MHHPVPALRGLAPVIILIAVTLLAYAPSALALWSFWDSQSFLGGQGPLVVALSAWLIVRSRSALEATCMEPSAWGCAALLVCSVASVIFWRSGIEELHMLLLPLLLFLAVLAAFGRGFARILAFPLGYLYFAEPTWRILIGPLQALTMRAVVLMSPLTGTPMVPSGTLLRLPHGVTFEVTPLCSGVNFLVVGLAVAALIGELQRAPLRRRAALLGVMALLMVLSNWLRVLLIVLAGYASGMRLLVTRGHLLFGWVLFALVVLGFSVWAARRAPIVRPEAIPQRETGATGAVPLPGLATATALLVLMPLLARAAAAVLHADDSLALHLPAAPAGWQGPLASIETRWKPEFVGAHSVWHAAYRDDDGAVVELLAIGYPTQEQGRELVNEENSLLGNDDMTAVGDATIVRGAQAHFEYLASDATGHSFVIWSVYDIGGRHFVTPLFSQLWYGLRSLGRAPYSVQFAYRAVCEPSCDGARARLARFERSVAGAVTVTREAAAPAAAGGPAA
jgi:EpsI family protein